jgi:hypothetical protein
MPRAFLMTSRTTAALWWSCPFSKDVGTDFHRNLGYVSIGAQSTLASARNRFGNVFNRHAGGSAHLSLHENSNREKNVKRLQSRHEGK